MIATSFLRTSALAVVLTISAAACVTLPEVASAGAPAVKTQAPGFYRIMVGAFEVTALSDGTVPFDTHKNLTNTTPAQTDEALAKFYLANPVEASINAFLINTGDKLVLVDTGTASFFGPSLGKLAGNLAAAGYKPEQVDEIYVTHFHIDHIGGLVSNGQMAFPNAIVRADKRDADYWLSEQNLKNAPPETKSFYEGAQAALGPYIKAGKFKPFDGDTDLVPGLRAMAGYGHTPGHTFYVAESNGQSIVFWGDLVHMAPVQLPNPSVTAAFDVDAKAAATQRKRVFADFARRGTLVGAAHIAFPGLGRLHAEGKGYVWVPVNYSSKP